MENEGRPLCKLCIKEGAPQPKLGFMLYDPDGNGNQILCGAHVAKIEKEKKLALIREALGDAKI